MAKFKIGNLISQVKNKLTNFARNQIQKAVEPTIRRRFGEVKRDLLDELEKHPVIEALDNGPGYGNYDPLGILGGYGDLYSFLGFKNGSRPTVALIDLFRRIELVPAGGSGLTLSWTIKNFPTLDEIEKATPLPWAQGFSWAIGIEKGVPGLGEYLNKNNVNSSRSRFGLQSKYQVRSAGTSRPLKWITPFRKTWFAAFETLENTKIL